jgi:hypothetical protein
MPHLTESFHGIIFAQGMAFPIFGHHNAAQVGMAQEADPEQVKNLSLEKVC